MSGWNAHLPAAEWYRPEDLTANGCALLTPLLNELKATRDVSIDTETTGLNIVKDIPLFWSLAWGERRMCMPAATMTFFQEIFKDEDKRWIFANAKYDMHILANVGFTLEGSCCDSAVMHALLYEEQPHGLKDMAREVLGWKWTDFKNTFGLSEKKDGAVAEALFRAEKENLPLLIEYAANDAYGTLKIYEKLKKELEETNTYSFYPSEFATMADIFFKTEMPYTKVLWGMERKGITIDRQYLKDIEGPCQARIKEVERDIVRLAGRAINPNSPLQLRDIFFNELKCKPLKYTKGGKSGTKAPSVDYDFLHYYRNEIPLAAALLEHRDLTKLDGTYIQGLQNRVDGFGRIHSRFNQDVARTGRLSCIAEHTELETTRGLVPVKELHEGDYVLTHKGRWRKVLDVFTKGFEEMYDLHLSNGQVLTCTPAHKLLTIGGVWLPAQEIIDEHRKAVGQRPHESEGSPLPVPVVGDSHRREDCRDPGDDVSQRSTRAQDVHVEGRATRTRQSPILGVQDRCEQSYAREDGRGTPQLQGHLRGRVRLPDLRIQGETDVRAPRHLDGDLGDRGAAEEPRGASHRLGPEEQQPGQPGARHEERASAYSLFAGEGLEGVRVQKVLYRGRLEVHDLTVEEDSSYRACGVFSHNSSDPNLQNVPTSENDKFKVRGAFIPQEGCDLIVVDYSALEMRLLAAAAMDPLMIQIFLDGKDIHMGNAEMVFGRKVGMDYAEIKAAKKIDGQVKQGELPVSAMTDRVHMALVFRQRIKTIAFGLNYGMRENKLARDLGITKQEALDLMDEYMATYPAVQNFYAQAIAETEQTGYSFTFVGRRRYHPEIMSSRDMERFGAQRQAVNNQIQGSAADVVRFAQLGIDAACLEERFGCRMLLQVHDELVFECPKETKAEAMPVIRQLMEHPFFTDLAVPLDVSMASGPSWLAAK